MALIFLAEVTAWDPDAAATVTLRYASGDGYNAASAPGYYEPRIVQAGNFVRRLQGQPPGAGGAAGGGELVLANPDGGLDDLAGYAFDGRAFALLVGDEAAAYSSFVTVLSGTVEQVTVDFRRVVLRLRDRTAELDVPAQPAKYAGTNSGSTGVEGLEGDLKGKPKPRCWGEVYNVAPPLENTSSLIYGLNHDSVGTAAPVDAVLAVRVGGAAWPLDTGVGTSGDVADLAALQAATITSGNYATCLAIGKFRLGSDPEDLVTADVQGDKRGGTYRSTAADVAVELLVQVAGIDAGDVNSADVSALNTANSAAIGLWVDAETTVRPLVDRVLASVGAGWWVDADGTFRLARLAAPSGSPVATFRRFGLGVDAAATDVDLLAVEREAGPLPPDLTVVRWRRHWTVQAELVGIAVATGATYGREWREATASGAAVTTAHLLAPTLEVETLLAGATPAATEATRLQALHGVVGGRRVWRLTGPVTAQLAAAIDVGAAVSLKLERFGLSAGVLLTVIAVEWDARRGRVTVEGWG